MVSERLHSGNFIYIWYIARSWINKYELYKNLKKKKRLEKELGIEVVEVI